MNTKAKYYLAEVGIVGFRCLDEDEFFEGTWAECQSEAAKRGPTWFVYKVEEQS